MKITYFFKKLFRRNLSAIIKDMMKKDMVRIIDKIDRRCSMQNGNGGCHKCPIEKECTAFLSSINTLDFVFIELYIKESKLINSEKEKAHEQQN
jgi:hypothetical protein